MSEKDNSSNAKFARIIPLSSRVKDGEIISDFLGMATDRETMETAMVNLADRIGLNSWTLEDLKPDGTRANKRYFFSGATWTAPWQPKGPKPNWDTGVNPSEPIN